MENRIEAVLKAADVVVWAYAVKQHRRRGSKVRVDLNSAIEDLAKALHDYYCSRYVVVESETNRAVTTHE